MASNFLCNSNEIWENIKYRIARKLSSPCCTVKWYTSCLWIHSFSSFHTTEEYKDLPPSPNGQGHTVHSFSPNWLTQEHSWNMGVHVVGISVTPKTHLKRPVTTLWPMLGTASLTPMATVQVQGVPCCLLWVRVCECMWMRNVNWESTGGERDVWALIVPHRKTFIEVLTKRNTWRE